MKKKGQEMQTDAKMNSRPMNAPTLKQMGMMGKWHGMADNVHDDGVGAGDTVDFITVRHVRNAARQEEPSVFKCSERLET